VSSRTLPTLPVIDLDAPLRLSKAAATAFPDGSMTKSGLRREAARGRLAIQRIAGKDYTTLRAMQLGEVHRAAAALVHDPPVEIAMAVQALGYEQKRQVALALRTSVMRLNAWAGLVLEAGL
jgi:hypothetical protein